MQFDRFTERAQDAATRAYEILHRYNHTQVDTEHLLLALLEQTDGLVPHILELMSIDASGLRSRVDDILRQSPRTATIYGQGTNQVFITPRLKSAIDRANEEANRLRDQYISTEHIFLALLGERNTAIARALAEYKITRDRVADVVKDIRGGQRVTDPQAESRYRTLEKYSADLTRLAQEGKLDPVIGRDAEILRVTQVLSRRTKNNPVLIGQAGVGKTAIVEGLAQKIASNDVPDLLLGKRVLSLDLSAMLAGSRFRGEFEERLKSTIEEIQRSQGEIILFIDELHQVVGAGAASGAMDAGNMMKPALARGELQTVGATTMDEYRQHIEKDSALDRRFAPIFVEEPNVDDTIDMLYGLRDRYEAHHNVNIADDAIEAAARLSARYLTERKLPDKAIDLLDEAAAKLRVALFSMPSYLKDMRGIIEQLAMEEQAAGLSRDYERAADCKMQRIQLEERYDLAHHAWRQENTLDELVTADNIAQVVEQWTGIPVQNMLETESEKLLRMEEAISGRVIGQTKAIVALADAIRRARSGLKDPKRPIGSFIFLGSSGVGKTELAKALAEFMFDDEDNLVRVDMSEYREKHTVSRLFGAPPGYVGYEAGGQLTEAVRRRPYRVILFDEIEKAHPDVWSALLQVLEDGRMTDGQGHIVDFRNTVLIMTSNLGTEFARRGGALGFLPHDDDAVADHQQIERAMRDTFRPEFLNRIDEVIIFEPLTLEDVEQMVDLQLRELAERMDESSLAIHLTESARNWLARQGYDPQFGARPLRRAIQRHIENPLSIHLLKGDFHAGDLVVIDASEGGLTFTRHADQSSDFSAPASGTDEYYAEKYPQGDHYQASYEEEDFADFLSRTEGDDEIDLYTAPPQV
ncbi:MAG: AAA domain-containing protein [Chloroflexi bacterium]|nr:AAA domain-containing protein [Chloroflexota bacterium]MXX82870.1 AAA domain-containing protein [Chloroflexota bacterium]MYC55338.1 AAA domain-containing protein [Chloroflexota bacterium]MYH66694.1 AAA domain-containing protein [Chloroflexota bacterium]